MPLIHRNTLTHVYSAFGEYIFDKTSATAAGRLFCLRRMDTGNGSFTYSKDAGHPESCKRKMPDVKNKPGHRCSGCRRNHFSFAQAPSSKRIPHYTQPEVIYPGDRNTRLH